MTGEYILLRQPWQAIKNWSRDQALVARYLSSPFQLLANGINRDAIEFDWPTCLVVVVQHLVRCQSNYKVTDDLDEFEAKNPWYCRLIFIQVRSASMDGWVRLSLTWGIGRAYPGSVACDSPSLKTKCVKFDLKRRTKTKSQDSLCLVVTVWRSC